MGKAGNSRKPPAPPKPRRLKISISLNARALGWVDTIAGETGKNRSEMLDDMIDHYIRTHIDGRIIYPPGPAPKPRP